MASSKKFEGEQFEEVMCNIASILNAEPGLCSTTRRIEEQYYKLMGVRIPRFGMRSIDDLLRLRPDLFELHLMPNGVDYEILLVQCLTEQGETMAHWNEKAARVRNKNEHRYYGYGGMSHAGRSGSSSSNQTPMSQPAVVSSLAQNSPQLKRFCLAVKSILEKAIANGKNSISVDDAIDTGHPDITQIKPANYGASGYLELLQMTAGPDFKLSVIDGIVTISPPNDF